MDAPVVDLRPKKEDICSALKNYPRKPGERMAFERGELSALCHPVAGTKRHRLDRCGTVASDRYSASKSLSSRAKLLESGKVNLLLDKSLKAEKERLEARIEELRVSSRAYCCRDDEVCADAFNRVSVSLCEPSPDPYRSDPCSSGGSFRVPGRTYREIFTSLRTIAGDSEPAEKIRILAGRNVMNRLSRQEVGGKDDVLGFVVLSSYVSPRHGIDAMEPVILHEFGHACSMVKMRTSALSHTSEEMDLEKVLRATEWLDSARRRCDPGLELPNAYDDYWAELGESKALSACLKGIAQANQEGSIDRKCNGLCPGHYLEEAASIAFSLLNGDLQGRIESVFPNTCDHVRDGQHPMVADVVECLAQNSPRFRSRLDKAYDCSATLSVNGQVL